MAKKIRFDIDMAVKGKEVIQSTVSDVEELKKRTREIPEDLKKLNESLRGTSRFGDIFAKITESGKPMQRQLREIQKLLSEMKFEGLDNTEEFQAMTQYAGNMADAIADARANVNYFASDTRKLDTAVGMFQGVAGALSVAQGALALFDEDNKAFEQTMKKVQGTLALVNGVQAISNTLNRDSALVMGVKNLQTKLATMWSKAHGGAVLAEAAATEGATVATRALNAVLKANPVGLVITAITTLIGVFAMLGGSSDETTASLKKQEEELDNLSEGWDELKNRVGDAAGQTVSKFQTLALQWSMLRTEAERNQWIKNNASNFEQLGLKITDVTTANKVFIDQLPRMITLMQKMGELRGLEDAYAQVQSDYFSWLLKREKSRQTGDFYTRATEQNITKAERETLGIGTQIYVNDGRTSSAGIGTGYYAYEYSAEEIEKVNKLREQQAKEARDELLRNAAERYGAASEEYRRIYQELYADVETARQEMNAILGADVVYNRATSANPATSAKSSTTSAPKVKTTQTKTTTSGLKTGKEANKEEKESLTELQKLEKQREDVIKKLRNTNLTLYERGELEKQKQELEEQIAYIKEWKPGMMDVGGLKDNEFTFDIVVKPDPDASGKNLDDFAKAHPLNLETKFSAGEWEGLSNAMNVRGVAQESMDKIRGWFDAGLIGREKAEELAAAVNANLEHNGIKPIKLEIDDAEMKSVGETLRDTWGGVQGLVGGFNSLSQALEGNKSAWEMISGTINSVLQIMDGFRQASQLISLFTASTQTATTATTAATAATTAHTAATTADTTASALQSTANATEAVTKATAEGTKAGWPGLLFAIPAALAVVMAGLAMAGAFANGGIVGGTSMSGDKLLARVNSGEMILNRNQQTRLFAMLNGLTPPSFRTPSLPNLDGLRANSGGTMDFRISGRNLVGVMANETRISRKSGRRTMIKI